MIRKFNVCLKSKRWKISFERKRAYWRATKFTKRDEKDFKLGIFRWYHKHSLHYLRFIGKL